MIKKLIRNARTALRHPDYFPQYVRYEWQRLGGGATIRMPWGDEIGGFINFSEYRSTPHCLDTGEITALARIAERLQAERTFNSDAYVLDVGANLGVTALYLAHLFPENPVRCFEPAPTTFAVLQANVERNHRRVVLCEQLAVSDTNGHISFDVQPKSRANARISNRGTDGISVPAMQLDNYCAQHSIRRIAVLKVDTEGYEHRVFGGAHRLLNEQAIDVIYYEFCPSLEESAGAEVGAAVKMLAAHGYKSLLIRSDGRLRSFSITDSSLPALCNLVAVSQLQYETLSTLMDCE